MLVLACAGSGKTTTIISRIYYLLANLHLPPESIILTTFSRQAAQSMKQKLLSVMGVTRSKVEVGTLDSLALKYLKIYGHLDTSSVKISNSNEYVSVKEFGYKFRNLLVNFPFVADQICKKKKFLFADEFQDIDNTQMEICMEFYKRGVNIIAVGDDAQNIYSFRGSNAFHILNFSNTFNNVVVHNLKTNYRSTHEIVQVANASLQKNVENIPKEMISSRGASGNIPTVECYFKDQSSIIFRQIRKYLDAGIPAEKIAVLSFYNNGLYDIESELAKNHIPHILLLDTEKRMNQSHDSAGTEGRICLSTIHKAKGMEWDVVFIVDVTDKFWKGNDLELRRLFYVAITRARNYLHLGFSDKTRKFTSSYQSIPEPSLLRFVRELKGDNVITFTNISEKHMRDDTNMRKTISKNPFTVCEMIKNITGEDISKLRDLECLPPLSFIQKQLTPVKPNFKYCSTVHYNQLYPDFGIFIDTLICRMISEEIPESGGMQNKFAQIAINSLSLDQDFFRVYSKYAILINMTLQSHNPIHEILGEVNREDRDIVKTILERMADLAKHRELGLEDIMVTPYYYFPKGFASEMSQCLQNFENSTYPSMEILSSIWEVSKCEMIVKENRNRLLYLSSFPHQKHPINIVSMMENYSELVDNLKQYFIPHLLNYSTTNNIQCHHSISRLDRVAGDMDLIIDGETVVEIKCSISNEVDLDWVLQLFCYAHLCREQGMDINKIAILNPAKGTWHEMDISWWNRGHDLIEMLKGITEKRIKEDEAITNMRNTSSYTEIRE